MAGSAADDSGAAEQQQPAPPPSGSGGPSAAAGFTTAPSGSGAALVPRVHSQSDRAFSGQPSFTLGPLEVHAGSLVRQFRVRQQVELSDRLVASAGLAYDLQHQTLGPFGTLAYKLEPHKPKSKSRIELSTADRRLLLRKGWEVRIKQATVGVSAEARLTLRDDEQPAGAGLLASLRPDVHLSLDHVTPLRYELLGIGLVLLLNLPLKLSNKEAELAAPGGLTRLKGFARASLKRTGYAAAKLGAGEASLVLDL